MCQAKRATFCRSSGTDDRGSRHEAGTTLSETRDHRNGSVRDPRPEVDGREVDGPEPEIAWVRAVARGDRAAFEQLYLHYHGRLARFLANHTRRRDLIDEIINETLWVVWRSAGDFRGESRVGTWIIGIAYRCLMKSLRDHPPLADGDVQRRDEPAEDAAPSTHDAEQRELRDWLDHGLVLLPPEQRMTIELAYYLGQSCAEIATIMNCAVGTVKARMFHARVRLRNTLPALGGDAASLAQSARG
jgi:RNA polymerase sigma-70 factor (ECF subfamily)